MINISKGFILYLTILTLPIITSAMPHMKLDEVKVGMEGTWDTVVKGDELKTFHLKVLGISPNFVGPRKPVIICEATDPEHILSGPVAGMSGSPVYINGKLIGAYAYGFTWPKEQAIIGVTPIESMMEIIDRFEPTDLKKRYRKSFNNGNQGLVEHAVRQQSLNSSFTDSQILSKSAQTVESNSLFPLYVSGISDETLKVFDKEAQKLGIRWSHVPTATTSDSGKSWTEEQSLNLSPGMPVAGVLMGGDFSITGVGTVTWKKGNKLLGFGHPFFGAGDVEIPMASARVLTIVQSLRSSFKLSEVGPVVGSIYQDRLTGIAGQIGRTAPTTDVSYSITNAAKETTTYKADLFEDPKMSPLLSAIGLLQSLSANLDADQEQTLFLKTRIKVKDQAIASYQNVAIGSPGATQLAIQLLNTVSALTNNPFEYPRVESIECEVEMVPVQSFSYFDEITIESDVPAPGETLDINIRRRNYLGEPVTHIVQIPIPVGTKGEALTLLVADANQIEPNNIALIRPDMDTLSDIIRQINQIKSNQNIYVRLIRQAEGFQLQGDTMYDLPPSVTHLFSTPKNAQYSSLTTEVPLWDTEIQTEGVFAGSYRLNIEIK